MTDQQPTALRLADLIDSDFDPDWMYEQGYDQIAAELRRLHFELDCANVAIIARDEREDQYLTRIASLEQALRLSMEALDVARRVANCAYNTGQGHKQWESGIRPAIEEFDRMCRTAVADTKQVLGGAA